MKKFLPALIFSLLLLFTVNLAFAQNQENFESASGTHFTNSGQTFNITSVLNGPFTIVNFTGTGWNGSSADNRYIDNSGGAIAGGGINFNINSSTPFKMVSVWMYLADHNADNNIGGSLSITGSLNGTTVFTATNHDFNNRSSSNNGFTLINFATFGGADNTGKIIDKIAFIAPSGSGFEYVALDAFKWNVAATAPTVTTTNPATAITSGGATFGGNVTSAGSASVTERGFVYGTATNPSIGGSGVTKATSGSGTGTFSSDVSGLAANTTYHFRAYATSTAGTSYGSDVSFTTSAGTVLAAGDIALVGYNFSFNESGATLPIGHDNFSIVAMKDIAAGTQIRITSAGWTGTAFITIVGGSTNSQNGFITWTVGSNIAKGSVFNFSVTSQVASPTVAVSPSNGTAVVTLGFDFLTGTTGWAPANGDQIFIFQGTDASPTFIYGMNSSAVSVNATTGWVNAPSGNFATQSALPSTLTNAVPFDGTIAASALPFSLETNRYNGKYTGTQTGSQKTLLKALANFNNWTTTSTATTTYDISVGGTTFTGSNPVFTILGPSTDATLSSLSLSSGALNTTFAAATTSYTASVGNATSSITVTPASTDGNATIQVKVNSGSYATVTSASASSALSLNVGDNTITILVTAEDGTTTKTYTVTVNRATPGATLNSLNSVNTLTTNAATVNYTATFSAAVTGLTASNFSLSGTGSSGATIGTPTTTDNINWNIPVNTNGDGALLLTFANATSLSPTVTNTNVAGNNSYTVDKTAPTVSISAPSVSIANSSTTVSYTVTYTDANTISNISVAAIDVFLNTTFTGTANLSSLTVNAPIGNTQVIQFNINGDGTVAFKVPAGAATDNAGNSSALSALSTSFTVDNSGPSVSIGSPSVSTTSGGPVSYTVTYSDASFNSSTLSAGNVTVNSTGTASASSVVVSGSGTTRTVTLSGITGNGTLGISVAAGTGTDQAGNNASAAGPSTTFTVDNTAPSISIGSPSASITSGGPVSYTVTYSDANFSSSTLSAGNITLNSTSTASASSVVVSGSGTTRTVTLSGITGDGTLGISIASGTATDLAGNSALAAGPSTTFTVDNTAPNAPTALALATGSDSGTPGDGITNVGSPFIKGTAEANATVKLYDTDGTTLLGTTTADGSGNWSIGASLAEGSHTLTAKATDAAGNVSVASSGFTVIHDSVGPTSMALSTNSVYTNQATNGSTVATLSSTDLTSVVYGFQVGNGVIDADNGKFTISGTSLKAAQNLTAGTYHIYLSGTDAASNAAYQIFTITVVDIPVVNAIVRAGAASATVLASATAVNYTVTFSQSVTGVDASDFTLNKTGTANGTIGTVTGSGTTYTVPVTSLTGDGDIRLDLNSSGTGIQNGSSIAIASGYTSGETYTLDHTAPNADAGLVFASNNAHTDLAKSGDVISLTFTASEPVQTSTVSIAGHAVTATNTNGNVWKATYTMTNTDTEGPVHFSLSFTDAAGNSSTTYNDVSAGDVITFDRTAPTLTITSNVSALKIGETATITFTFSEDPGTTFTWDGSTGDVTVSGGTLSAISGSGLTRTATFTPTANTNNGTASITVAANSYADATGNNGGAGTTPSLSFDTKAPNAPSAPDLAAASDAGTSSSDNLTNVTTPTFTGTAEANATVKLYDTDGTTLLGTTTADGSGNWSIISATLAPGSHTVTVKATDAAGNVSLASTGLGISIDTTAPTLAITSNVSALKAHETATITFTFSEDPGNTFTWDGTTGDITVSGGTLNAISGSGLTRTATFTPTPATNNGTVSITVAANSYTDAAGNNGGAGTTPAISFDTKAPNFPSAPATTGTLSNITINNPTFTGTAEANSTVKLYDTDKTTLLGTTTADGSGNWSITSSVLTDASHTITATATDAAGNVSEFSNGTTITVNTAPTIYATAALTSMTATYGAASAEQSFTLSGTNLTEGIKVTAPTGFEVSKDNSSYAANITIGAAGSVSTTTVYVRLSATDAAGNYNGNVALSSASATTVNVATNTTNTVNKATATITLSNLTATYDGTAKSATATTSPVGLTGVSITYGGSATPPSAANTYAVVASLTNANYTAINATGNLIISPKTLNVTATAANKGYDGTTNANVTLSDNRISGDTFTTNYTAAFTNKNQGTGKTVNITGISISGEVSANYTLGNTTTTATADIAKKAINVTAQTDTKTYDGSNASAIVPVTDALATGDLIATAPVQTFNNKNVGSGKTLTATGLVINDGNSGGNYTVTYITNTSGKINAKAINVTAQTDTKTYDGNNASALVPVTDALATGDLIATAPTQTFDNKNAGTGKTLTAAGLVINDGNSGNNYTVSYVANATGKINTKAINVTAQTDTKIYDATTASAVAPLVGTLISGDIIATAPKQTFDTKNAGTGKTLTPAGLLITDGNSGNNYAINYITNTTGVINTATLTYTANTASRNYGQANPAFSGTVTGFAGSDTQVTATTGTATFTTTATIASAVGSYAINGSGLTAVNGNYTFVQAAGNATALTIGKTAITVTAATKTKVYGQTDPQLTYSITTGALANGDTFSGSLTRDAGEHVNTYAIKQGTLALSSNYTLNYTAANFSITPADLTIKADNQSKTYGQANPVLTVSYSGFVNGDDKTKLTSQPGIVTTALQSSPVGSYPITASSAASGDYTISYTSGTLSVTNAALTVTADNESKVYGQANPGLTVSYSGFVNGDDKTKLTTAATAVTAATQASGAGIYPIAASGAAIPNYTISYVPGSLTISKAPLTVTADNQSRNYGLANPDLTVAYSGFVNGDDKTKLTTAAMATTTATATTAPGTYAITPAGAASANYSFTYVNGNLTIIPLTNADMTNLTVSAGTLSPDFDTKIFGYKDEVPNAIDQLSLTPTIDPTATVRINGSLTTSGSPSFGVPLNVGDNTLVVEVTAQDGVTKKTYRLIVYRGQPPVTIDATNILTPNGDGQNDQWVIKDIQLYPNNVVTIYDRGGRIVYEKRKYNNEWDGTLRGIPLAQGTYYYTVDLGPGFPKIKGFITLLRSSN